MVDNSEFVKDRMQSTEKVLNSKHIDEYMGCTFIDLIRDCIRDGKFEPVLCRRLEPSWTFYRPIFSEQDLSDVSDIEEGEVRSRRASLDAISTSSESYRWVKQMFMIGKYSKGAYIRMQILIFIGRFNNRPRLIVIIPQKVEVLVAFPVNRSF